VSAILAGRPKSWEEFAMILSTQTLYQLQDQVNLDGKCCG